MSLCHWKEWPGPQTITLSRGSRVSAFSLVHVPLYEAEAEDNSKDACLSIALKRAWINKVLYASAADHATVSVNAGHIISNDWDDGVKLMVFNKLRLVKSLTMTILIRHSKYYRKLSDAQFYSSLAKFPDNLLAQHEIR